MFRTGRLGCPGLVHVHAAWRNRVAIESHAFDVVVAGCGIAGLSAAVSALEEGASVAIIERAP
ncbi:MAG: FAD-dependent oxidoreductase, partial [Burkholderiales bacterium]